MCAEIAARLLGAPKTTCDRMLMGVIEAFRTNPPDPPPPGGTDYGGSKR